MTNRVSDYGRVAVLMGGWASERDISLISGKAVYEALLRKNLDVHAIDVNRGVINSISAGSFDRVFNVLHGRGGEDGVIQGVLDTLGIPYTGSGVLGSAVAMDKYRSKLIWQALGLPTPGFALVRSKDDLETISDLGFPLMVKPVHEGSSIGMSKVESKKALMSAWNAAKEYDDMVMVERWIDGDEYTVGILGKDALPLIRLETKNNFYDYQAKYESDETRYLIPCGLDSKRESELQLLAMQAFDALGAKGWGRVDLLVDEEGRPWLIEVNTVPGMTSHSLVPMAAKAKGLDFDDLVLSILAQTLEND